MPDDGAYAFSTVLPDNADVATLIGGASDVDSGFLGPGDEIFGTAILGADFASQSSDASSTFDFHYQGNLFLGLIEGVGEFNVTVNIDLTIVSYGVGRLRISKRLPRAVRPGLAQNGRD